MFASVGCLSATGECVSIYSRIHARYNLLLASNNLFFARYLTFNIKNYIFSEIFATFAAA